MQQSYDVVIVGGAVIGSAIAYFLTNDSNFRGNVLVVERDPTYAQCSTTLSAASIRHQFSTPENIEISKFGTTFIKDLAHHLSVPGQDPPDVGFAEGGYLFAATAAGLDVLRHNHRIQRQHAVCVALLAPEELKSRFPWLNVADLAAGSLGLSGEGWFDAYLLLMALRRRAKHQGATFIQAEVTGIDTDGDRVQAVRLDDGSHVRCGTLVNAAGPRASQVAQMVGLQLPVHPRKRHVFVFDCRQPIPRCPLVVDPSGVYFRPEGRAFICGMSPPAHQDPDSLGFDVDDELFYETIWPTLAHRVPAFEAIKLLRAWTGHYAVNSVDHNAVLGPHPEVTNFLFANGFSGHGLQQAPAVGRGIAELIVHGRYRSLDLSRFGYERLRTGEVVREHNVV